MAFTHLSARKTHILYGLLFLILTYALCSPLLKDLYLSGRDDWDYFSSLYEVPAISLFGYHQFPLWNPYCGGGMPLIGNPQAGYLSPIFLATSLFGVFAGLKIAVLLHTFLGLWGMWMLSGHLGMRGPARLAPPLVFMLSSSWAIHMAAGQIVWLPAAFLPLFFLTFHKGMGNISWLLLAAVFESLMFYEGGTYVLGFSLLFVGIYTLTLSIENRSLRPLLAFMSTNFFAAVLSAPKLMPVLDLLHSHPRLTAVGDGNAVAWDTYLSFLIDRFHSVSSGSVDIGSYLGITVVLLYICSLSLLRKHAALVIASLFMLTVSFGNFGELSPWNVIHRLPFFASFHEGPSRSFIVLSFTIAIMVGLYLQAATTTPWQRDLLIIVLIIVGFAEFSPWKFSPGFSFVDSFRHASPALILAVLSLSFLVGLQLRAGEGGADRNASAHVSVVVIFIGIDLFLVSSPIFAEATKPSNMFPAAAAFASAKARKFSPNFQPQPFHVSLDATTSLWNSAASTRQPFFQVSVQGLERNVHGAWSDQYLPLLQNRGVADAYETLPVERHALAYPERGYQGEFYLLQRGEAALRQWSPVKLTYHVRTQKPNRLVINQNYWGGWHTSRGVLVRHEGLLAVDIPEGEYDLTVSYLPNSFVIGLWVLAGGTGIMLTLLAMPKKTGARRIC